MQSFMFTKHLDETPEEKSQKKWLLHGKGRNNMKIYSEKVMGTLRQYKGLEPNDTSEDEDSMNMAKQDVLINIVHGRVCLEDMDICC